jgi:hypothetical protein
MKYLRVYESFGEYGEYDKLVDNSKNPMLRGYLETALFADLPEEHINKFGTEDINFNSLVVAHNDVNAFTKKAAELLNGMGTDELNQVGTDFWYTRNGHGTGFWDREKIYGEELAKALTDIAETFPSRHIYVQDGEFFIE